MELRSVIPTTVQNICRDLQSCSVIDSILHVILKREKQYSMYYKYWSNMMYYEYHLSYSTTAHCPNDSDTLQKQYTTERPHSLKIGPDSSGVH